MSYLQWEQLLRFWAIQVQFWGIFYSAATLIATYWTKKK